MTQADTPTPVVLIAGRHITGMAIVALANPLIYHGGGLYQWSITLGAALLGASVVYGLYALFFTERAKAAWPGSFFVLAWVMLALALLQSWTWPTREPRDPPPKEQTFTYEEAYGLPPSQESVSVPQAPPRPVNWDDFTPVDDKGNPLPQRR